MIWPIQLAVFTALGLLWAGSAQARSDVHVRIGIIQATAQTLVGVSRAAPIKGLTVAGWKTVGTVEPEKGWKISAASNRLSLLSPDENCTCQEETYQRIQLEPSPDSLVFSGSRWYRGQLDIYPASSKRFAVVNQLPLEQYLLGVVPSEMPTGWPLEALKAQAVAARTYAIDSLGNFSQRGYDMVATPQSQVYLGVEAETAQSNQAVELTRGEILTYQGKPIHAYYHSTSGGMTENGSDLWGPFPYLKPVIDFDQASPRFTWYKELDQAGLLQGFAKMKVSVGKILNIVPMDRTQTGRVKTVRVVGDHSAASLDAMKFRMTMGLNSTFFNVGRLNDKGELLEGKTQEVPALFQFAGRGWGHGMGMSQWGARQLALNGVNYRDILTHYYSGVQIEPVRDTHFKSTASAK